MVALTTTEQLYTVNRLGQIPGDDPHCVEVVETFGPMTKREAQNKARRIYDATGDFAEIFVAGTEKQVASVMWNGGLFLEFEYDDEGNKLPIDRENNFWSDAEPLPEDN